MNAAETLKTQNDACRADLSKAESDLYGITIQNDRLKKRRGRWRRIAVGEAVVIGVGVWWLLH